MGIGNSLCSVQLGEIGNPRKSGILKPEELKETKKR
jgi:hypothetical protein